MSIINFIRNILKEPIIKIIDRLIFIFGGYHIIFAKKRKSGISLVVLAYHNVIKKDNKIIFPGMEVTESNFRSQIKYLMKYFEFISLDRAIDYLKTAPEKTKNKMVITFDDGYCDNFKVAVPILREYNIPATIFVTTDPIKKKSQLWGNALWAVLSYSSEKEFEIEGVGRENITTKKDKKIALGRFKKKLKYINPKKRDELLFNIYKEFDLLKKNGKNLRFQMMTKEQLQNLQETNIQIENHTATHPAVIYLNKNELEQEISAANAFITEYTGKESKYFAYPFGSPKDYNDRSKEVLKKNNVKAAFSLIRGTNDHNTDPYEMKRIPVKNGTLSEFVRFLMKYL